LARELTVNGDVYNYPENRDSPGWGEEATAWAEAVTDVLAEVSGTGDILQTTAVLGNSGTADVTGFLFDPSVIRGAVCEYSIYRKTDTSAEERVEVGTIFVTYKTVAGTFEITVVGSGGSGITLSITGAGQIQYTVNEILAGANYVGTIKFRARSLAS
jgi:hypothetical protein